MRFHRVWAFLAAVGVCAILIPGAMYAQTIVTGAINGVVTDPTGAAVAGATVTLTSTATNEVLTQKTGSDGSYHFPLLKPGTYTVTAEQQGFQKTTQTAQVFLGQTTTADVKLQLGSATATVEVTGAPPLLQTQNANIATTFTSEQIQTIPNPGNDITYVAQTAPGVVMNNSTLGGYGNFSAFGLPATANLFTVDGNDYNDPFLNLNNSGASNLLLGSNDIEQATVVSNGYTGQYGRQAGAQVDYTTKSGSNSLHGNLIYQWTGRLLNANDPLNKLGGLPRPFENNNQWAASLGGPIKKNKAFFFVDTEGIRYIFGSTNTTFTPTPDFQSFVLGNLTAQGASPQTLAFYNNVFNLYNHASGIAAAVPQPGSCDATLPSFPGPGGPAETDCLQSWKTSLSNGNKEWLLIGRVDYNFSDNDKLYGRFKTDHGLQPTYTDPINPVFDNNSTQPQYEGQLNYTHIFSANVVNNFLGSVLWYSAIFGSQNTQQALSLFPGNLWVYDTSMSALGTGSGNPNGFVAGFQYPQGRNVTQWGLVDDLSINHGNHDFKMGFNWRRDDVSDHSASILTQYPVIETSLLGFANDQISPAGAEAAGVPGSVFENFARSPVQPIAFYSFGVYFQDGYQATRNLKLTLALRVERNSGGACQHACAAVPVGGAFSTAAHGGNIPYNATFGAGRTSIVNVETAVFEPRVGVAWTPFGKNTVLRAGAGVFSDLYPGVILDSFTTNFPQVNVWTVDPGPATVAFDLGGPTTQFPASGPAAVSQCNSAFSTNYTAGGNLPNLVGAYSALPNPTACFSGAGSPLVPNYNSPPSKLLNPKYVEWNLEIEHTFGTRTVVSANYVGNHGYDELLQDPYLNAFCDTNCAATGLTASGLPGAAADPRVGSVVQLSNNSYSNYNGVTFSLKENNWHGLFTQFNYTYSHALDVISNGGTGVTPFSVISSLSYQVDPLRPSAQYGPSDYDARHALSANYMYEVPFTAKNWVVNEALGGWQVAGTFFWHSPFPFTVIDGATVDSLIPTNNMNHGTIVMQPGFPQRNFSNGAACAQAPCFGVEGTVPPGTPQFAASTGKFIGSVGRNAFRGPGYFGADFSLLKNFKIKERMTFQLGMNVYNVFNHANYGDPWPSTASLTLGQTFFMSQPPTSPYGAFAAAATDMRMAQIVGKFNF